MMNQGSKRGNIPPLDKRRNSKDDPRNALTNPNNNSTMTNPNQSQLVGDEENKLIHSARKAKPNGSLASDESRILPGPHDTPVAVMRFEESTESSKRTAKLKVRNFLHGKLYSHVERVSIVGFYLILLIIIFLDEYLAYSYKYGTWYTIEVLVAIELALVTVFCLDLAIKTYCFGTAETFHKYVEIGGNLSKIATLVFLILDLIFQSNTNMNGVATIHAISRILMIVVLAKQAVELSKARSFKIDIMNSDYHSPITKILEIMSSVKSSIKDEVQLSKYNWAMEMISSNKLYEPLLELLDKNQHDSEGKNWITKYAMGLREETPEDDKKKKESQGPARRPSIRMRSIIIPKEVMERLDKDIEELYFNVFDIKKMSNGEEVQFILYYIFEKSNLFEKLSIDVATFCAFANKLAAGYLNNPYHNCTHSADVTQTIHHMLRKCSFIEVADLTPLEIAACYIAGAIHDYEHPGTNNTYHINTKSVYALRYNGNSNIEVDSGFTQLLDKSVLENHHISASYQMMMQEQYSIFKSLSREDLNRMRERLIAMVLATDMANHFSDLGKMKGRLSADFNPKEKDKNICMELIVHASDISNPGKPFDIYKEWTFRILEEFWNQGDKEREAGLPITYLCDRYTVNTAKSQIGFIDFIVFPTFDLLRQILPRLDVSNFDINKQKWKEQIEFYDKELAVLNEKKKEEQKAKDEQKAQEGQKSKDSEIEKSKQT